MIRHKTSFLLSLEPLPGADWRVTGWNWPVEFQLNSEDNFSMSDYDDEDGDEHQMMWEEEAEEAASA